MADRIPSLDGLRAVAIGLVLIGHIAGTAGAPAILSDLFRHSWVDIGDLGVRIFFVISGLLITTLLLEEQQRYGRISLGRFVLRRTFRIFPAFLVFLLALRVAQHFGLFSLASTDWWHALTYTVNYHVARPWEMGHLWSLSVEEQFYVIWPCLILLAGTRRAMLCAAVVIVLAPLLRTAYLHVLPASVVPLIGITFETAADSLAVGCLLACYRDQLWANATWRRLVSSRWFVPALFLVAYLLCARTHLTFLLGFSVLNLAAAVFIERSVRLHDRDVAVVLNSRPLAFIGVVSYSLYLWQQPFLNRHETADLNWFPQNVILAVGAAILSYYCIERPALGLRHRLEGRLPARTQRPRHDSP